MTQNCKIGTYLMQNFMEVDMKKFTDPKTLTFRVRGLKTNLEEEEEEEVEELLSREERTYQ